MKINLQTARLGMIAGALLTMGCFLYFWYVIPYHVCFKEQIQLFVFSGSYIGAYFSKPASLACLGGDFLTQFLYFRFGGAATITLLLLAEWMLIYSTLKRFAVKTWRAASLPVIPVMLEWILFPDIAFYLSFSVSFIIVLSVLMVYTRMSGKMSVIVGVILIPVLYLIAGASVFLFLFLAVLYDIHCGRKRLIYWTTILGLSLVIPFLLRHEFLLTSKLAYLFPYQSMKHGLSLAVLSFVVLITVIVRKYFFTARGGGKKLYATLMFIILVSILMAILVKNTDTKQENLFGLSTEAWYENWDKVLEIAEKRELQNPIAAHYTNLALSHKNLLGERLMDFYQPFSTGLLLPTAPGTSWFSIFSNNDAYYHIGDMDMAQHGAMVGLLSSPRQRSVRLVERLADINLAIGDMPAATKYLRMLDATLFHKKKTDRTAYRAIFKEDVIRIASNIKMSLELLVESNPDHLPAVNYLLCYYLLTKNIPDFFKAYTLYFKGKTDSIPKIYAEALLIYFAVKKTTVEELMNYSIHPDLIKSFGEYTQLYEKSEANLAPMQEKYPNTYWLFYHFAVFE